MSFLLFHNFRVVDLTQVKSRSIILAACNLRHVNSLATVTIETKWMQINTGSNASAASHAIVGFRAYSEAVGTRDKDA